MDYVKQLENAIIFLEENLTEPVKVEEAANHAGYSYYHFHRVFEAVLGETVGNYLRSRRLSRAADDLLYTDSRILDIALKYRFESQAAFSRAFKKIYQVTPGIYRRNRIEVMMGGRKPLTLPRLAHLNRSVTLQPSIREIGPVKIVGMRDTTTIKNNRIPALWAVFNPRAEEIPFRTAAIGGFGICEVDPAFDMRYFTEDTPFTEFVGVAVSQFGELPSGMAAKVLTGGKYAVFTHRGRLDTLQITYDYIWGTWVPVGGFELDLRDDFEFYDHRFLGLDHPDSEMDIYVPIK